MNQFKSQEMAFENRQRMMEEQQKAIMDKDAKINQIMTVSLPFLFVLLGSKRGYALKAGSGKDQKR
jgi:hypothetical protein